MVKLGWFWVSALTLGCTFGPLDETGKHCSTERPCSPGFFCLGDLCQPAGDGGRVNLLKNPSFEEGAAVEWKAQGRLSDERTVVRTGAISARVSPAATSPTFIALLPASNVVAPTLPNVTYCASLYVRGAPGLEMNLLFREHAADSTVSITLTNARHVLIDTAWTLFKPQPLKTQGGVAQLDLRLQNANPFTATDYFLVDDAEVYQSQTGTCP